MYLKSEADTPRLPLNAKTNQMIDKFQLEALNDCSRTLKRKEEKIKLKQYLQDLQNKN